MTRQQRNNGASSPEAPPIRCCLYLRVSTQDQNCDLQRRELTEYVQRRGWEITDTYTDLGISGSKASRPELDRLMRDASRRKFDCVCVYKLDRFGRSVLNLSQSLAALDSYGVRFVSVSQGLDTDQSNPTSRLLLNILSSVASFELDLIKERTAAGVRAARAKGKLPGRPKRIFRRDEVVRLRDSGMSWRAISTALGVPVMTVVDAYRTESPSPNSTGHDGKDGTSPARNRCTISVRNSYINAE
jgi:putative DNA-invertase from lambdoid prophage Rac